MADYQSIYTGQEIDTAVGKATKLPTLTSGDNGKTLQVDSSGNIVAVSGGGSLQGYTVYFSFYNSYDDTQGTYAGYVIKLLNGKYICEAYNYTGVSITESIDNVVAIFVTTVASTGGAGSRNDYFSGTLTTNGRYAFSIDGAFKPQNDIQDLPSNKLVILCANYTFDISYND